MLNNAIIERQDYKVHFRSYSNKLYGYSMIMNGERHYIINDRLNGDMAIETLYRLMDLANEYIKYGFIMLQEGNRVYADENYQFNEKTKWYVYDDHNHDKIVNFSKYKYSPEYGIQKFKDRW